MIGINRQKAVVVIVVLTSWFALILQLYILISNTPGNGLTPIQAVGRFFIFFTILTNLLVAICMSVLLISPRSVAGRFFSRPSVATAVTVYIFIVGLVYNIVLRNIWDPKGMQKLADELLHVFVPLLFTIYWIMFAQKSSLKWSAIFRWLLYPALYVVYAILRGSIEGFYPYPFLDADKLTWQQVFLNCAGLLIVFVIFGLLFIAVGKRLNRAA